MARVRLPPFAAFLLAAVALLAFVAFRLERRAARPAPLSATLAVDEALGGEADPRFARAEAPREFRFPADHGVHEGFRTEWWYVTANLFAADGRAFGAQLTFFRNALAPPGSSPASGSRFRDPHVWMAHFALSDERAGRFRFAERFAREAAGLAGIAAKPFALHVEEWSFASTGDAFAPLRLAAREREFALELELVPAKPPVLQGEAGLSRKGPEPGNASYYYSIPRLAARGTVEFAGRSTAVEGEAWLDREWSTSALAPELAGWDWFALQLSDGRELMFYRLRRKDGGADPLSRGSLVERDGTVRELDASAVELTVLSTWKSPHGSVYPSRWRFAVPTEGLELELRPRLDDQELALTVRYWEGAVAVAGTSRGATSAGVTGHGFVEMTGYAAGAAPAAE
jgi:predicted secreted hydrolase